MSDPRRRYCTANQGHHRTLKANLECPYHRALAYSRNGGPLAAASASTGSTGNIFIPTRSAREDVIVVDTVDGTGRREIAHLKGDVLHREGDLPAKSRYRLPEKRGGDAPVQLEEWWVDGEPFRGDGGPTSVYYDEDGSVDREQWCNEKGLHREGDLPAEVTVNGQERYFLDGMHHRDGNMPAAIVKGRGQDWYVHGKRHRDNGPATVFRTVDRPPLLSWYLDGQRCEQEDVWARYLVPFGVDEGNREAQQYLWRGLEGDDFTFVPPDLADVPLARAMFPNP